MEVSGSDDWGGPGGYVPAPTSLPHIKKHAHKDRGALDERRIDLSCKK